MNNTIQMNRQACDRALPRSDACLFLPRPWLEVAESAVQRNQTIRAGGELYRCEYLYCPNNTSIFARGLVRHFDDRTIRLPYWHRLVSLV